MLYRPNFERISLGIKVPLLACVPSSMCMSRFAFVRSVLTKMRAHATVPLMAGADASTERLKKPAGWSICSESPLKGLGHPSLEVWRIYLMGIWGGAGIEIPSNVRDSVDRCVSSLPFNRARGRHAVSAPLLDLLIAISLLHLACR